MLTNGEPHIQRRKVAALGIGDLVDDVLFAAECGDGTGKPAPSAFRAALDRLNVEAARAVFVGDDPRTDIEGAAAVGMKTIHVMSYFGEDERCGAPSCRIHVRRLDLIPGDRGTTRALQDGVTCRLTSADFESAIGSRSS